jgi:DNA-binding SARP family transcriptional activator
MQIKVLGPLEAELNSRSVTPTAAKPRQVLALLALRPGRAVPVPTLVQELWGDRPPRSARTTLQTYVLQLRRLIAAALAVAGPGGAKNVLVTRFGGYLLDISPEDVDVHGFERLVRAGERAHEARDHESASRLLGSALALWRGPPLVDVRAGPALAIEVVRLDECRLGALESRIDSDLRIGRHHTILSELAMLTAQHPTHENLCAQYMISLFRSGRQWQALDAFKALRSTLVDELGVEPSTRLRQLRQSILDSDPRLDHVEPTELRTMRA